MIHKIFKRIKINFRNTHSERAAGQSYTGYKKQIRNLFNKTAIMAKFNNKHGKS